MSLQDYYDLLERHDWYYYYSDDSRAYAAGQKSEALIKKISDESPDHKKLFAEYMDYRTSQDKPPKPDRPGGPKVTRLSEGEF